MQNKLLVMYEHRLMEQLWIEWFESEQMVVLSVNQPKTETSRTARIYDHYSSYHPTPNWGIF
jgi:hypothetical protein